VVPVEAIESGQVAVALGARIDVDLLVGKGDIFDFLIRFINILKSEKKAWPFSLFNKIQVVLRVENTGNVAASPTRVHLDVYKNNEKNILESTDATELEKINPFETKEIYAEFKTQLEPGTYYGAVSVYKGDEISRQEKIIFNVEKITFSTKDWLILVGAVVVISILLALIIFATLWMRHRRKKQI
jgi:hypothetical protein